MKPSTTQTPHHEDHCGDAERISEVHSTTHHKGGWDSDSLLRIATLYETE